MQPLTFKPTLPGKGYQDWAEVTGRSGVCTRLEMEKLQRTPAFQAWEKRRKKHRFWRTCASVLGTVFVSFLCCIFWHLAKGDSARQVGDLYSTLC